MSRPVRGGRSPIGMWVPVIFATAAGLCAQRVIHTRPYWDQESGAVALRQAVLDASTDTLALLVASHPDDRYVLPAAYLRFKLGWRVAVLLFTRGKGGQNSVGPETGDALGRIRTLESEASAAHLGAKVYYLNRPDNGFSRSAEETLAQWNERETVRDTARLIRQIQPDVVLTTHDLDEEHGHDLALLAILPQALRMCADPAVDLEGAPAFTVSRFLRAATTAEENEVCVSLEMDGADPVRGGTFRRLAYRALEEHRSQWPLQPMGELFAPILELVSIPIGDQPVYRSLDRDIANLFSVLDVPTARMQELRDHLVPALSKNLSDLGKLSRTAIELQGRLREIAAEPGSELERRVRRRMAAVERIILESAGVQVLVDLPPNVEAASGHDLPLPIWIRNEGDHEVTGIAVSTMGGDQIVLTGPSKDKTNLRPQESIALQALYRPPSMSEEDLRRIFSRDTFEHPMRLRFRLQIGGQEFTVVKEVRTDLRPAMRLEVTPAKLLLPSAASTVRFVVGIERKAITPLELTLRVNPPAGMTVRNGVRRVELAEHQRFGEFMFRLNAPGVRAGVSALHVQLGEERLRVNVHKVDVEVRDGLRVGLIPGVDDAAYEVLHALLGDAHLEKFDSDRPLPIIDSERLDTIVVDIRALRSPSVCAAFPRLLDFVEGGGRLVVFYHKDVEFNLESAGILGAPYPLVVGKGRVTREDAPVRLLLPDHVIFNYPNKIRPKDWDGWKQERGLYFPSEYDASYQELLVMNDPGLPPERGSMLYARHGKGDYVYCALAIYRQIKNLHPGACRLFANLISSPPRED